MLMPAMKCVADGTDGCSAANGLTGQPANRPAGAGKPTW